MRRTIKRTNLDGALDCCIWVGENLSMSGCVSQGNTFLECINELEENEKAWRSCADYYNKKEELQ